MQTTHPWMLHFWWHTINLHVYCLYPQEVEYAIEVTLSDESQYTIYRPIKEIALFHVSPWNWMFLTLINLQIMT